MHNLNSTVTTDERDAIALIPDRGTPTRDMGVTDGTDTGERAAMANDESTISGDVDRWLATGLAVLAVALAANSLLGPLLADAIAYPFSETMVNQTIGLEAVTLAVVVPWCLLAAVLVRRGHPVAPFLAIPPSAYTAYMFLQYVIGPQYLTYRPVVVAHLGIFVLGGALLALAWWRARTVAIPAISSRRERRAAVGLLALSVFVVFRYLPAFAGMMTGEDLTAEFAADPSMFWSIFFLDLGVVVPVSVATALGLLRGAGWARRAVYGVAGWYVLVPISVAAMAVVMLVDGDPNAAVSSVAAFVLAAVAFTAFAGWVYRPLFDQPEANRLI